MKNTLITAGCSFSTEKTTWTDYLAEHLNVSNAVYMGLASSGNQLIARKAVYAVSQQLATGVEPNDILVGIMWSGPSRMAWFIEEPDLPDASQHYPETLGSFLQPPHKFIDGATGAWIIGNPHFGSDWSREYYWGRYCNSTAQQIMTYEAILLVQSLLKSHNIDYFMTTFTDTVFLDTDDTDPNISWMRNIIDWQNWLPITGCLEWCNYYAEHKQSLEVTQPWLLDSQAAHDEIPPWGHARHPERSEYEIFTDTVILPFLEKFQNRKYK